MNYSIIVPVYNEAESLKTLDKEIHQTMTKISMRYEVIYVNDGSTDGSKSLLEKISTKNKRCKLITLRKRQGKSIAYNIGFKYSSGKILITLDADLQDIPSEIPKLLKKMNSLSNFLWAAPTTGPCMPYKTKMTLVKLRKPRVSLPYWEKNY